MISSPLVYSKVKLEGIRRQAKLDISEQDKRKVSTKNQVPPERLESQVKKSVKSNCLIQNMRE